MNEEQAAELLRLLGPIASATGTDGFSVTEIVTGSVALLAFLWSVVTYFSQRRNGLARRQEERTLDFINEFFSRDFTAHRAVSHDLQERMKPRRDEPDKV